MKAIAINGSPREDGNTAFLLQRCLDVLAGDGIEGALVQISNHRIESCTACNECFNNKDMACVQNDDFNPLFERMTEAEIIVVGSPVYFGSATPPLMALLDRAGYVGRANGNVFSRKLGGPIAVARRAGHSFTYAQLLYWYFIMDMVVPGSTYWNVGIAHEPGEVAKDTEAVQTIERFAENLAWLAKKLY